MSLESKKENKIILFSVMITVVLAMIIFWCSGMFPGQDRIFMLSDMYYQYIDTINMFIRKLLHLQPLDYSFDMGLGMPTAAVYAVCSFSPFNLLFAVINDLDTAAFIITISKLAVAAGCFSFMALRILRTDDPICGLFSSCYALGGYSINFASCIIFLDGLYVLPIIIYALYRFLKEGKWKLLCVTYAYIFIVQLYSGYIIGIFTAAIFLTFIVIEHGKNCKKLIKTIYKYSKCVSIAFLLSAVVIVPECIDVIRYSQADANTFEGLQVHITDLLGAFFIGNNMHIYNVFPAVYGGVIMLLLVPIFFLNNGIDKKKKIGVAIILVFLLICTLWAPAYLFMHVFNNPNGYAYRFSYFWTFVIVFIAFCGYVHRKEGDSYRKYFWISRVGVSLIYGVIFGLQMLFLTEDKRTMSSLLWMINVFFVLLYGCLLANNNRWKWYKHVLGFVISLELIINGYFIASSSGNELTRMKGYYDLWQQQAEGSLEVVRQKEAENPHSFYRLCYQNSPIDNISMLYGYHGLGYFSSIENVKLRETMSKFGYASSSRILLDYGSTPIMRMLFGQRYLVQAADPRGNNPQLYSVVVSPYTLDLGYMVSENMKDFSMSECNDPFLNQNRLVSAMCGQDVDVYYPIESQLCIQQDGIKVEFLERGVHLAKESDGISYLNYHIRDDSGLQAYAYFSFWGYSVKDMSSPHIISRIDRGCAYTQSLLTMPHILPLAKEEDGDYKVSIIMGEQGMTTLDYENQYFVYYDETVENEIFKCLSANEFQTKEFTDTKICGSVDVPEGKRLLFTTIPYDERWKVWIDGKRENTIPVLDEAFVAVPMEVGMHEVVFEYVNPWKYIGFSITMIGFAFLLIENIVDKRKRI